MAYIGILAGGLTGFLYWYFIGCESGTCPITSNKFISIGYGALLGAFLFTSFGFSKIKNEIKDDEEKAGQEESYKNITSEEFELMIIDSELVIIDVRTPNEWQSGYIPGTDKFLDFHSDNFFKEMSSLDKSKNYIIYCRSGNRSGKACEKMSKSGFKNLHNLSGGIINWKGEIKKD